MTTTEWTDALRTGIDLIDSQHEELIRRIDRLSLAVYNGRATAELLDLLEYTESYIIEHFATEEQLMLEAGYPDYAKHLHEHDQFRDSMKLMIEDCRQKGADSYLALDVEKQMRKWFENHILRTDMAYVPCLKK